MGLVEVRPCAHGRGLFAVRYLPKGKLILHMDDLILTANPRSPPERSWALRVGEREYWDEAPRQSKYYWSNFIDHNDRPNSRFYIDREKRTVTYKTLRPVRKGEELFLDYAEYYPENPVFPG